MKKLIFGVFISILFLGCAGEQSAPQPNKNSNKFIEVPITFFGQEIKGYALENEFRLISKRCDSDASSSSYTQNVDAGYLVFNDGKELSCDIILPKRDFIYTFAIISDYAQELSNENSDKGFFSSFFTPDTQTKKKANERPIGFGMVELKADVNGHIMSKKERFDYGEGLVPKITMPFGNSQVDEFKIYVKKFYFDKNSKMSSFKKYFLNANVFVSTIDTNNYDFIHRSVFITLKTRQNEYKNKDLLDDIKAQNPRLYNDLSPFISEFILPKNSGKKQTNDDFKLKISDEEVNYKTKQESQEGVIDFAK